MSIATRIEAIEEHLTDDYSVLTLAGADLTNVDKNIINLKQTWEERLLYFINNGTEVVWNNWNKVQGSGYTLTLNNTLEAPMTIEYKGNTSQGENPTPTTPQDIHIVSGDNTIIVSNSDNTQSASYPIYLGVENYLPNNATTQTTNGITYTINEDKSININGTASGRADLWLYGSSTDTGNYTYIPKGTYTIDTSNLLDGTMFLQFREKTAGVVYQTKQNNGLLTLLSQQDCYLYGIMLAVESGKTINNLTFYPQIEKGTKLNSYTPYGTTPIELCKIGTYKDRIFKSSGKNKYNGLYTTKKFVRKSDGTIQNSDDWSATDFIPVAPSTTYRLSGITNGWSGSAGTSFYDETKTFISSINSTEQTFTTPNNAKYIRISLNTETPTNIMLNEGTTALPYEPYGKDWYLNKQIGKVVLNGSENWNGGTLVEDYMYVYCNDYDNIFSPNMAYTGISTHFKVLNQIINTYSPVITTDSISLGSDTPTAGNRVRVKINKATTNTIANFKTWLSTNNVEVYYVLNTPTYEKITGELLNQLEAIKKSYENQTNINQENNDLPFELEVGALEKY